jgi:predicted choloylglycine hydrolase
MKTIEQNLFYSETSGSFYEIGLQYGSEFQSEIQNIVTASIGRLKERFNERQINKALKILTDSYQKNYPYLFEEIKGVSTGASVSLEIFTTHLFGAGINVYTFDEEGCSDIIFPSSDKGPLLGKTHDATTPEPAQAVVRIIRANQSYNDVLCISRPDGFSIMTGLNDKGLAIGESSIHFLTSNKSGTIRNLLLRPLLHECDDVNQAVEYLANHPLLTAGFHYALVDKSGNAAVVEKSPTVQNVRWSKGKVIFCTNHCATPFMRKKEKSRGPDGDRNSDMRFDNMKKFTSDKDIEFSFDSLKTILTSHDKNGGICQHGDPEYRGEKSIFYPLYTQRAFINIVHSGKLLITNGCQCQNEFLEFCIFNKTD